MQNVPSWMCTRIIKIVFMGSWKDPQWSLMHDGISKFSTEYNGVYLKGIDGALILLSAILFD